jgi:iron complex transport system ATP-binding protein
MIALGGPGSGVSTDLSFDDVSVSYGSRRAVRSVSLSVQRGEVVALAGPNGSGKSSLIRAAVGLAGDVTGRIRVGPSDVRLAPPSQRARLVAWMPQEELPGDNIPLADYVEYGRYAHIPPWTPPSALDRLAVRRAIAEVDLGSLIDRGISELSGGERQRARLARVLAQDAPALLLDEPTAHLDIGHQLDVLERIRAFARREERAVLIALHDLNLAARYTDRIAVLAHGRLVATGAPSDVLSPELLESVWGVLAEIRYDPASGLPYLLPRLPAGPKDRTNERRVRVHVVAGGGSGAILLRTLFDRGYGLSVGVVPLFDTDTELAGQLGVPVAAELPFAPVGAEALERLDRLLGTAAAIVVAPFPVGPTNLANLEQLRAWVDRRPVALVDQPEGRPWDYTGGRARAIRDELLRRGAVRIPDVEGVIRWLERMASAPTSGETRGDSHGPEVDRRGLGPLEPVEKARRLSVEHDHGAIDSELGGLLDAGRNSEP